MDSTNVAEIFASMGVAGGVTAILSMILLRQIDRAAEERQEWLAQMRAESAETRATLNELRQAVVDLRVAIASQMNQT
ncbi:MAG: hypothetical protein L7S55_09245 [Luminiphilus sp.]|nr:hypothetical protein [Luminiphilus sp.]